ncbi:MAG: TrmH family RNA methyltransferase [Candidatus Vogelbacteria bacterium]|nr:TrmH family RNA methyltransferase [Candidatus Vogelbacteria bacterium]
MNHELCLILHNIRSVYNVGAIFRTADACGVAKIYLTGYTPTPLDRFGLSRKDLHKAALGAEKSVAWEQIKSPTRLVLRLKSEGLEILALEQSPKSVDYKNSELTKSSALIIGNEVRGVSESLLEKCDKILEIPMRGKKESLNVSVATGILLARLLNL